MMIKKHPIHTLSSYFPALAPTEQPSTHPEYYFDNAATAFTLAPAIQAMTQFYEHAHGSVHRGVYESAEHTTVLFEQVRQKTASFIGADSSNEIIFTAGATDGLNTVAYVWARHILEPGDGIIITQAEHHAHYVLWHQIAQQTGAVVYVLPLNPYTYCVDLSGLDHLLHKSIKVVAVTTSSNVLGPVWGDNNVLLTQLIKKGRSVGAGIILDAAQTVAHAPIDVKQLDCDFLAFSVHKMGGPTGLGVLYARQSMHPHMKPFRFGGGMVAAIAQDFMTWQAAPHCFEAGTPPIAQVIGLGAVLDFYTSHVDFPTLRLFEAGLCEQLIAGLESISGVHIVANSTLLSTQGHLVAFYVDGIHAHDLASTLSQRGCSVRAGDHCAQPLSAVWNNKATLRVSFFMYNTSEQVMYLLSALRSSIQAWREIL